MRQRTMKTPTNAMFLRNGFKSTREEKRYGHRIWRTYPLTARRYLTFSLTAEGGWRVFCPSHQQAKRPTAIYHGSPDSRKRRDKRENVAEGPEARTRAGADQRLLKDVSSRPTPDTATSWQRPEYSCIFSVTKYSFIQPDPLLRFDILILR